jgi:cell division transport system permease protein
VLGAIVGTAGLVVLKYTVLDSILERTGEVVPKIELLEIFFPVAPILLGVSVLISAITGYVTLRLYVRH